jgi:hypothetical protein
MASIPEADGGVSTMSDPRDHGVPGPTAPAEDAWWDIVYDPSEREGTHRPSTGTVDDWFASALGAIGAEPTGADESAEGEPRAEAPVARPAPPPPRTPAEDEGLPPVPDVPPIPNVPPVPPAPPAADVPPSPRLPDPRVLPPRRSPDPAPDPDPAGGARPNETPKPRVDPLVPQGLAPEPAATTTERAAMSPDPAPDPRSAREAAPVAPPHVPTPTLPDGAALRWGRSRPAAGAPLPEPDALPEADPEDLGSLVPDTALELARHGSMTLRAASARGEEARALGVPRGDRLIAARFGDGAEGLLVTAVAAGPGAEEAVRLLAASVGRSRAGLLADLRQGAQEQLRFGLQRLTARAARGLGAEGALHALLAPLDPTNRLRAGFGTGAGALLLLGDDAWYDAYAGRRLTAEPDGDQDDAGGQPGRFRFRAVVPEPGDVLLLCTEGLATPLRAEPAVAALLAEHWSHPHAPSGVDFLRQIQARASGHSGDRTAAAIWEE